METRLPLVTKSTASSYKVSSSVDSSPSACSPGNKISFSGSPDKISSI